jgi:APA family basic amino acid/polyamine antiporter
VVLFSAIAVSAVFVLRRQQPDTRRPFRAWGYPWAPAVFVAASAAMLVNEIWRSPGTSAAGLAIMAAGVPVYWWMRRRTRKTVHSVKRTTVPSLSVEPGAERGERRAR